jgi:circadian clock protein KaiC
MDWISRVSSGMGCVPGTRMETRITAAVCIVAPPRRKGPLPSPGWYAVVVAHLCRPETFRMTSSSRVDTSIAGLDIILGGGLPGERLYLIEGDPGTGKTTLALQFLLAGARRGEPALYVTLSETHDELRAVAESHGWSLDGVAIHELSSDASLRSDTQYTVFHPSEVELGDTMNTVLATLERVRPNRVVFDSLSEMRLLARDPLRYRRQILALKQFFVGHECTVLLLDDRTAAAGDLQLQSIAHGVVRLETLLPEFGGARRRLRIMKLRGVAYADGYHDYVIRTGGLEVFPRLVAAEHRVPFTRETVSSGVPALDALVGGGLGRGTTTLLIGPAGSGKSLLASHFVHQAASRGDRAAVFIFDEGIDTYFAGTTGIGLDMASLVQKGRVSVQQVDPAELSPGEFVARVRESVERDDVRIVMIDSLNGYLNAMPEERLLALHLHELFSYLRQRGVLTINVMSQQGMLGQALTPVDVSYLADAVILLRFFEAEGMIRKAISMVKRRAGAHESTIRELHLSSSGISLGEPLTSFRGILTGVPQYDTSRPSDGGAAR